MWNFIIGLLRKLRPGVLTALPILLFGCFILLNVAIWWAGPKLELFDIKPLAPVYSRILASGLLTLGSLAVWLVWQWKKIRRFQVEQKNEEQIRLDPILVYEKRQETELNQVMDNLKQNLNSKNYLYSLPWYLVLGLENAGKTSLINRSGQNFSFSSALRASGQKSENPFSFDWWIGDDSVLIDPDGELLSQGALDQESDSQLERRLWLHFVNWLEKTRNRRPLNGIVLAVDISQLAIGTSTERLAYADLIRARLRELMESLSTRLPVYITLTKLDLLYGFEAFFKNYTKSQRDEVLGFTFTLDSVDNVDKWLDEFVTEYSLFVERINANMPHIVSEPMSLEDRKAIYSFVRQLSGLKDILSQFLQRSLKSDQFSTAPLVRGVYLTSVYQQGVPTNAFDDAASRRYGLSHKVNSAQKASNSTAYFTQNLFTKFIYPEAGLASDNRRVAKANKRLMGLTVFTGCLASALLIGSWHHYYQLNVKHTDAVLSKVNRFKEQYPTNKELTSQKEMLMSLNRIREATLEFGFFRDKPQYVSDMGLYQGHTIGPKVEETYLSLLKYRFLPKLMADLIVDLQQAETEDAKLAVLRVYRMMVDKSGRMNRYVMDYFSNRWQREFTGNRQVQEELLVHLDYAMLHTDLTGERLSNQPQADKVLHPYDNVIAKAQSELGNMPNDQRVYRNLKLQAQSVLGPSVNLRNLIGPVFDVVFVQKSLDSNGIYIPQFLTKQGFEDYFLPQSESVSKLALIDSWVLGQVKSANFSEADKRELKDKIRQLYVADYVNTWQTALNDVDIKYLSDIDDAVTVLNALTGNMDPIARLLHMVNDHTQLIEGLNVSEDANEELVKTPKFKVASMIEVPFFELSSIIEPVGNKPAYLSEVLTSVEELRDVLKSIQGAPDSGMAALDVTKSRMKLLDSDPIFTLKRISSGLPSPLDSMFNKLADESWYVVKQAAIHHLDVRWNEDVYKVFQEKLANRYPFSDHSSKDVSLNDFEAFFGPNGSLNSFYNNQLKLFVEENIQIGIDDQTSALVSPKVLAQFDQAQKIRSAFFNRKGILDVNFSVEPLRLSSNKRRSVLNVDGQYLSYSHGSRERVEFIWPNTLRDTAISKVTLVPIKQNISPRSINIQGPWAFFRLLDSSDVIAASPTSVDYKFSVDDGDMIYRIHSESDANPFTDRLFKSFKLSRSLY